MAELKAREVKKAVLDCKAQAWVGTTTDAYFIDMVSKGTLTNFPVTLVDIANARHMFGPDLPGVKSKTVQRKPDKKCSSPRCPVCSHSLVCSKNSF